MRRFFFATITEVNEQLYGKQDAESGDKKDSKKTYVWEQLIHYLSDEFKVSWEEVLKWNVYTFNHRLKFINFTKQQETKIIQRGNRS